MSEEKAKKEEKKQPTVEERLAGLEMAMNAMVMYVNTLEKWRHMDFKPPQKDGENEDTKSKEASDKGSEESKS